MIQKVIDDIQKRLDKDSSKDIVNFSTITTELTDIYKKKNADYGNSFQQTYKLFGDKAAASRLHDKMARIISLVSKDEKDIMIKEESLKDTIKDIVNYGIMWLVELENKDVFIEDNERLDKYYHIDIVIHDEGKYNLDDYKNIARSLTSKINPKDFIKLLKDSNITDILVIVEPREYLMNPILRIEIYDIHNYIAKLCKYL